MLRLKKQGFKPCMQQTTDMFQRTEKNVIRAKQRETAEAAHHMRTPDAENSVFWGLVKPTPKTRREGKAVCRRYETWAQSEV